MSRHAALLAVLASLAVPLALCAQQSSEIYVNGALVTQEQIRELQQRMGLPSEAHIPGGRYWYDNISGLWGMEGGPTQGQLLPGLELGGALQFDASGGQSTVIINGRAIHPLEVAYLQRIFGYVIPGRYWLNWQGIGGPEGGPAMFNLLAAAQQAGGAGGGGYGGYTRRTPFGSIGGDGNCSYFLHPNGSSVMNC